MLVTNSLQTVCLLSLGLHLQLKTHRSKISTEGILSFNHKEKYTFPSILAYKT